MLKFSLASMLIVATVIAIGFGVFWPTPKRVPELFTAEQIDCEMLANAVNYFVKRGEASTIEELAKLAEPGGGINRSERVGWVCRILWDNEKTPIRQPDLGMLNIFGVDSTNLNLWPLYPVAKSGDTYFVLSQGYSVFGPIEFIPDYIEHCCQNGKFRRKTIAIPTRDQALKDILAFQKSNRWQTEYPGGGPKRFRDLILLQADSIVEKK